MTIGQQEQQELSTEERILEAAKKVFMRDGLHGSRMETIAQEAGVTKASLHYYFRSKEKLFEVIFDQIKTNVLPRIAGVFSSDIDVFEKIKYFVESYIDLVIENPYLPLFIVNELNKNPEKFIETTQMVERIHLFLLKFVQQLLEEIEKGNIRPIHPLHLVINVMSMCVFPFLAKPMLQQVGGMNDEQYRVFLLERKKVVVDFVINAIKV